MMNRNVYRDSFMLLFLLILLVSCISPANAARIMENLDRGVVAVNTNNGVFVSWRMLGTEPDSVSYNLYRNQVKVNSNPIIDSTNYLDTSGSVNDIYSVASVFNGVELEVSAAVNVWANQYLEIPLQVPANGTTPSGSSYSYSPNDASVGDLDGDGQYEIVLKWDPSNSQDNSKSGYTGNVYLDAYEFDGTLLWQIDLGINIRAGAHYTQFIVYDLDSDGKAEVACRTSDGTKDGLGEVIGDQTADYRRSDGYIVSGPEYLTIFDGVTGGVLNNSTFYPNRGNSVSEWGDGYGNRCDRFLAGVAYLDGQYPSLIMARGYYGPRSGYSARNEIVAYNWRNGQLDRVWYFKAHTSGPNADYIGQGCHSLSINDVDADGKDEIVYGSCVIDDDGTGLYTTGLGHGDALHVSDFNPETSGLELWMCHEDPPYGASLRNARTGAVIARFTADDDTGRACAGDITASSSGVEMWASGGVPLASSFGSSLGSHSNPINFMVWWDGDLLREFLDSNVISKYQRGTLLTAYNCSSNNSTKSTPCLSADILGDWREEVIWRTSDNTALRIYTTTIETEHRLYTLMHDSQYRTSIAWQNTAYNQPPHTSFFLGSNMQAPPVPDIQLVNGVVPGVPSIYSETWNDVPGDNVSDLKSSTAFPDNPSSYSYLTSFAGSSSGVNNYGKRLKSYLVPKVDGEYTFWIAANDSAELWLSSDAFAVNAELIASVVSATNWQQWDVSPEQQSDTIYLEAGRKYYIELLYKQGTGDDHFAVAWQGPGVDMEVVASEYLQSWYDVDYLQGDLNEDNVVDVYDLEDFCNIWLNENCSYELDIDFNGDCVININDFSVIAENWLTDTAPQNVTIQIQEDEAGFNGVFQGTVDNNNAGFTGSGFANTNNQYDQYIEWEVEALADGYCDLSWRFANGASADRTGTITVNGSTEAVNVSFANTGSWTGWDVSGTTSVMLSKGANTIRLFSETSSGLANIDWIEITGPVQR